MMTETPNWILGVDPGGQTTGLVLARLQNGILTPTDGLSFQRLESERDTLHSGEPDYVRRFLGEGVWTILDRHAVHDEDLLVAVETLVPPRPVSSDSRIVPMAVWRGLFGAHAILATTVAVWPDAILVFPDGHDEKKGTYPRVLWGRKPKSWMAGSSARKHQRAAWSILLSGLKQAGIPFKVAPDDAPLLGVDVDADDLAAVVAAIRLRLRTEKSSLALLIDTTFKTRPELTGGDLVDLALAAAETIKPSKDPTALHARLAAALDSLAADSLV
jgi:hypothetical protein